MLQGQGLVPLASYRMQISREHVPVQPMAAALPMALLIVVVLIMVVLIMVESTVVTMVSMVVPAMVVPAMVVPAMVVSTSNSCLCYVVCVVGHWIHPPQVTTDYYYCYYHY